MLPGLHYSEKQDVMQRSEPEKLIPYGGDD
nr:MAG TPA: hypothetical protein [Caudoviricetes sp.]